MVVDDGLEFVGPHSDWRDTLGVYPFLDLGDGKTFVADFSSHDTARGIGDHVSAEISRTPITPPAPAQHEPLTLQGTPNSILSHPQVLSLLVHCHTHRLMTLELTLEGTAEFWTVDGDHQAPVLL